MQFVYVFKIFMLTYTRFAFIIYLYTRNVYTKGGEKLEVYKYPNIEAERARNGFSQEELIKRLGYKERRSYYCWLTNGNIPTSVLIKMADLFDCSVDYLLGRTRNPMKVGK